MLMLIPMLKLQKNGTEEQKNRRKQENAVQQHQHGRSVKVV